MCRDNISGYVGAVHRRRRRGGGEVSFHPPPPPPRFLVTDDTGRYIKESVLLHTSTQVTVSNR